MGAISDDFGNGMYHAVYLDEQTDTHFKCRNSFGKYMDPLILEKDSKAIHSFWEVHIKKFVLKPDKDDEIGDITLLQYKEGHGYANIYERKWTGYNTLRGLFDDYYVDEEGKQTDLEHSFKMGFDWKDRDENDLDYRYDLNLENIGGWTDKDYTYDGTEKGKPYFTQWPKEDTFKFHNKRLFEIESIHWC